MKKINILILVALIGCLQGISSDIYAPSIPAIANYFNSNISSVQLSMAIFMLGVCISQLVYGVISDGYGRRTPLLVGLFIMLAGSICCYFSSSINFLIIGRFIQGCGAGACAALWRSIFRDNFKGAELAKYGSYLSIIMVFVVPAAPTLGGYLQEFFSWNAAFIFLIIYVFVTIILIFSFYKETSYHHHPDHIKFSFKAKTYKELLTSRIFVGYSLCSFFTYGAFFSWFTIGPVILIDKKILTPIEFGWFSLVGGGITMALAGYLNGKKVSKYGMKNMLRFGWSTMTIAGALLLLGYYFFGLTAYTTLIPILIFFFGVTFIWPNVFADALTPFGHIAGYAGSLYGFIQLAGAAVIGMIISKLHAESSVSLAAIIIFCSMVAWGLFEAVAKFEK